MKVTLDIPDDLLQRAVQRAADEEATLSAVLAEALTRHLADGSSGRAAFRLADGSFKGSLGLVPGAGLTDWPGILDLIYEGRGT